MEGVIRGPRSRYGGRASSISALIITGGDTNEHFEIEFSINLQDSTLVIFSFFSRADDAGPDAAYARLRLPLDAVSTNHQTVYKDFVATNTRAKWLIPVYGRVFRRSYREFVSLFLQPEPH